MVHFYESASFLSVYRYVFVGISRYFINIIVRVPVMYYRPFIMTAIALYFVKVQIEKIKHNQLRSFLVHKNYAVMRKYVKHTTVKVVRASDWSTWA